MQNDIDAVMLEVVGRVGPQHGLRFRWGLVIDDDHRRLRRFVQVGKRLRTGMPQGVLELMKLYPQPVRTQSGSGVEYLPVPRQNEPAGREA